MKFEIDSALEVLTATPFVMESQLSGLNKKWFNRNEGKDTWNASEIICHMIHCEEDDWIPRMKVILSEDEDKNFKPFDRTFGFEKSERQPVSELLNEFKELREISLKYLRSAGLSDNDLNKTGLHPDFGKVTLRLLLAAWVVHDLSHCAQISRVLAKQYNDEVGPWKKYLPILKNSVY
ncbi:MAG: DinB family protein [Ignavibacteria bacterium]